MGLDRKNENNLWQEAIETELKQLMEGFRVLVLKDIFIN
jgi:hypothetical protein